MVLVSMGSPKNPLHIIGAGTPATMRTTEVKSRTKRFKVRQSDQVDLMYETRSAKP